MFGVIFPTQEVCGEHGVNAVFGLQKSTSERHVYDFDRWTNT